MVAMKRAKPARLLRCTKLSVNLSVPDSPHPKNANRPPDGPREGGLGQWSTQPAFRGWLGRLGLRRHEVALHVYMNIA